MVSKLIFLAIRNCWIFVNLTYIFKKYVVKFYNVLKITNKNYLQLIWFTDFLFYLCAYFILLLSFYLLVLFFIVKINIHCLQAICNKKRKKIIPTFNGLPVLKAAILNEGIFYDWTFISQIRDCWYYQNTQFQNFISVFFPMLIMLLNKVKCVCYYLKKYTRCKGYKLCKIN